MKHGRSLKTISSRERGTLPGMVVPAGHDLGQCPTLLSQEQSGTFQHLGQTQGVGLRQPQ